MTNIIDRKDALARDGQIIERAQKRLQKAHLRVLRKGLKGGWRKVARDLGFSNMRYVWEFANKGIVPKSPSLRQKLGLPKVLPSERKPRVKRDSWRAGLGKGLERL